MYKQLGTEVAGDKCSKSQTTWYHTKAEKVIPLIKGRFCQSAAWYKWCVPYSILSQYVYIAYKLNKIFGQIDFKFPLL